MTIIEKVAAAIRGARSFLVSTHDCSDGDAIGSEVAINLMLRKLKKRSHIVNEGPAHQKYEFLQGVREIGTYPRDLWSNYDIAIVVDTGGIDRLAVIDFLRTNKIPIINIDHHITNTRFGTINWVDPNASSVGEMTYSLIRRMGVKTTKPIAMALYTSLIADTGHFTFPTTTDASHVMASELLAKGVDAGEVGHHIYRSKTIGMLLLEADVIRGINFSGCGDIAWSRITMQMHKETGTTPPQIQDLVEIPRSIGGVKVAVLFRETPVSDVVRVSLRSEGEFDVAKFAQRYGGGGHTRAAGFTVRGSLPSLEARIVCEIEEQLSRISDRRNVKK